MTIDAKSARDAARDVLGGAIDAAAAALLEVAFRVLVHVVEPVTVDDFDAWEAEVAS